MSTEATPETQPVAEKPVESVTRVFVVGKRYPLLVEGDFTEVLAKLEPSEGNGHRRFGPTFRQINHKTGQRIPAATGLWCPNLDNISGVSPAEVPVPSESVYADPPEGPEGY